jgi:serine/threonine protein kinase/tetratricopeptide (TPR) repeat protein
MIGKTISHYKIVEKLGGGGMGVVYKAVDTKLDRTVALKFLHTAFRLDKEAKQRFINEAKAASSLQHNNICTIHDIDETDEGQLFISMDLYEGKTLKQKIERGALKTEEAIDISTQVVEGLSKAHEKKIIHRDIKPANIFITKDKVAKILDFGLAKSGAYANITKMDSTKGTIAYISPEQAQGKEATQQSDIWSLGVLMYEMLTGHLPFKGDYDQVLIYSILDKEPERITSLNPEIPIELEHIVNRALEKDVGSRYQNIQEMLTDLLRFKNKSTISGTTQSIVHRKNTKQWIKASAISVIFLVFALSVFYLTRPFWGGKDKDKVLINIAVIGFENQTGDSTYNYLQKAIPNLLITNLEQSEHLHVTTWERMHDLVKQIDKDEVELIDKELGFELCRAEGVDAIVLGSFIKAGNVFATDVKVLDVATKNLLKSTNTKSEGLESILEYQIDYLSEEIIDGIGITAREIESVQLRIADVSTTSMEAYNHLLKGREELDKAHFYEAINNFEKAVQIDSTFAVAYLHLGITQYYMYETRKANEAFNIAEKYKYRATDRERIQIEAQYSWLFQRDIEKSINTLEKGLKSYPNEKNMHLWLGHRYDFKEKYTEALNQFNEVLKINPDYGLPNKFIGNTYAKIGEYEKALDYMNIYISKYPQNADSYYSLGMIYFRMGRIDQAIDQIKMASKINEGFGSSAILATLFALKEDYSETHSWGNKIIDMRILPSLKYGSTWWITFYHYWTGNINKASVTLEKMFGKQAQTEVIWIARADWLRGWINYDMGKFEQSKKYFNRFFNYRYLNQYNLTFNKAMKHLYFGLTDLEMGKIDSVRNNLEQIKSISNRVNKDLTNNINSYYNLLYGMVLIKEDSLNKAEEILKTRPPVKLPSWSFHSWGMIYLFIDPLLQDGLARIYIKRENFDKAIDVYQDLISNDIEIRGFHLINPKYHYRLAKLYELKGWNEKSIFEYEKFLKIWKDADKDLPEFIDAKSRLENLTSK